MKHIVISFAAVAVLVLGWVGCATSPADPFKKMKPFEAEAWKW